MKKPRIDVIGTSGSVGVSLLKMAEKHPFQVNHVSSHNNGEIEKSLTESDLVILCLPDDIAERIQGIRKKLNSSVKIIDCSPRFRVDPEWTYGLPEIIGEEKISQSILVANPGCHATAALLSITPLMDKSILSSNAPVFFQSLTGYSGGGKEMIKAYENNGEIPPKQYSLENKHKHLPEIRMHGGIQNVLFQPTLLPERNGILCTTFAVSQKTISPKDLLAIFEEYFSKSPFISVKNLPKNGEIFMDENNGTNFSSIYPTITDRFLKIITVLDNLGKGAAGAALQNAYILMGENFPKTREELISLFSF